MHDPNLRLTLGRLATVPRGRLKLVCIPCHRTAYYAYHELVAFYGASTTFGAVKSRAFCKECGRTVDDDLMTLTLDVGPATGGPVITPCFHGVPR